MKDFKICELDLEKDIPIITQWDKSFSGTKEYEGIQKFILEDDLTSNLTKLIETNYEQEPIGDDEVKKIMVAKTSDGDILGFLIFQVYDMSINRPKMFLQYIVINPEFQHQGYGKEIFSEFFSKPRKYTGVSPKNIFAVIDKENFASMKLFLDLGFDLDLRVNQFFMAKGILPEIQKRIQSAYSPS